MKIKLDENLGNRGKLWIIHKRTIRVYQEDNFD